MEHSIEQRAQSLRDQLNHHNYLYYVLASRRSATSSSIG